ncbi:hypothetical protein RND81_11G044300 [Saponaria officinalis]|uniref:Uncharacterized protein n=1 Tax=Saponaria officinalis TaxID=3572 RepID=A0AAW1HHU4_SAPOF
MGNSEISDEFSDWEEVSDPYDHRQLPSSPPNPQNVEYRLVLRENYYSDGSEIFPPTEHEGLPLLPTVCKSEEEDTLSVSSLSGAVSETDSSTQRRVESDSKLSVIMRGVGRRMFAVFVTNFRCQVSGLRPGSVVVPGAVIAVAVFACLKILQLKNRLLLLIREKDQRISQLMSQIAQMNEILSARRKVPILRIN